jgi:hypothetical protein
LTARCWVASAEPVINRGAGTTGAYASVVEKRCGASAEAIAQASSARDVEEKRIENMRKTSLKVF